MCALVPPLFPNFGWPSEEQIYRGGDIYDDAFLDFPAPAPASLGFLNSSEGDGKSKNPVVVKKMNHNANERDRRKKINALFSTLRSLLPASGYSKKLSIPATVSYALKYIPEMLEEIKKLLKKKEELLLRVWDQRDLKCEKSKEINTCFTSVVSATRVGETELMVQISSPTTHKCSLGNVLSGLEEDGYVIMDVSSSWSQGDRLFYTLHLQVEVYYKFNSQDFREKLLSLYEPL